MKMMQDVPLTTIIKKKKKNRKRKREEYTVSLQRTKSREKSEKTVHLF